MTTRAGNTICNFCNSLRGGDFAPSTSSSHLSPRDIFLTRSGKAIFDFARTFLSLSVKKIPNPRVAIPSFYWHWVSFSTAIVRSDPQMIAFFETSLTQNNYAIKN